MEINDSWLFEINSFNELEIGNFVKILHLNSLTNEGKSSIYQCVGFRPSNSYEKAQALFIQKRDNKKLSLFCHSFKKSEEYNFSGTYLNYFIGKYDLQRYREKQLKLLL